MLATLLGWGLQWGFPAEPAPPVTQGVTWLPPEDVTTAPHPILLGQPAQTHCSRGAVHVTVKCGPPKNGIPVTSPSEPTQDSTHESAKCASSGPLERLRMEKNPEKPSVTGPQLWGAADRPPSCCPTDARSGTMIQKPMQSQESENVAQGGPSHTQGHTARYQGHQASRSKMETRSGGQQVGLSDSLFPGLRGNGDPATGPCWEHYLQMRMWKVLEREEKSGPTAGPHLLASKPRSTPVTPFMGTEV